MLKELLSTITAITQSAGQHFKAAGRELLQAGENTADAPAAASDKKDFITSKNAAAACSRDCRGFDQSPSHSLSQSSPSSLHDISSLAQLHDAAAPLHLQERARLREAAELRCAPLNGLPPSALTEPAAASCSPAEQDRLQELCAYFVSPAGLRVYHCRSGLELICSNIKLIEKLRSLMCMPADTFSQQVLPVLISLTEHVSVLPASQGNHDIDNGGLLRHSILTAVESLAQLRLKSAVCKLPLQDLRLVLLTRALCHDLGKVVTDMQISADDGRVFNPLAGSISSFVEQTGTRSLHLAFNPGRGRSHDSDRPAILLLQSAVLKPVMPYLQPAQLRLAANPGGSEAVEKELRGLVHAGDLGAVRAVRGQGLAAMELPSFVYASLGERLRQCRFSGCDLKLGVFAVGSELLILPNSPLLYDLARSYEALFDHRKPVAADRSPVSRFLAALRNHSLLLQPDIWRLKLWHKFCIGNDIVFICGYTFLLPHGLEFENCRLQLLPRSAYPDISELCRQLPADCHMLWIRHAAHCDHLNYAHCLDLQAARTRQLPAGSLMLCCDARDMVPPKEPADLGIIKAADYPEQMMLRYTLQKQDDEICGTQDRDADSNSTAEKQSGDNAAHRACGRRKKLHFTNNPELNAWAAAIDLLTSADLGKLPDFTPHSSLGLFVLQPQLRRNPA